MIIRDSGSSKVGQSGWLLTLDERAYAKYGTPFALCSLSLFALFLWWEVMKSEAMFLLIVAIPLTGFLLVSAVNAFRTRGMAYMQYSCEKSMVQNYCRDKTNRVDCSSVTFITVVERDFAIGKATITKCFYVFSNVPFSSKTIRGNGLFMFKRLWQGSVVFIPVNDQTKNWIQQTFGTIKVAAYPRISCLNAISKTD